MRFLFLVIFLFLQNTVFCTLKEDLETASEPLAVSSADSFEWDGKYRLDQVPNPKNRGQNYFVSNPDGILSSQAVEQLNQIANDIEKKTRAEFAIVIVDDYYGDSDFDFALELFNKWGIGKKDNNSGLLLFVSKSRHQYRFISGYGLEGILPDASLKSIGETLLVPYFRKEDYDQGVLEASNFIAEVLNNPDSIHELKNYTPLKTSFGFNNLEVFALFFVLHQYIHFVCKKFLKLKSGSLFGPILKGVGCMVILMFLSVFIFAFVFNNVEEVYQSKNIPYFLMILGSLIISMRITAVKKTIEQVYFDVEDRSLVYKRFIKLMSLPMIISPLTWSSFFSINRFLEKSKERIRPPYEPGNWIRIVRQNPKQEKTDLLSQGQRNEELIGSRKYEIWLDKLSDKVIAIPWEINDTFIMCKQCGFYTLELNKEKVIDAATYYSEGQMEEYDICHNCNYRLHRRFHTIPRKVRSSPSSSSTNDSSSDSSSSSSGGSFGGGSSGGGGAGGSW